MDKKEWALDKIQKCLKLSESNSNDGESNVALRQAHALMKKYNIDLSEAEKEKQVIFTVDETFAKKLPFWVSVLLEKLSKMFQCTMIIKGKNLNIIGLNANTVMFNYALSNIMNAIKKARRNYLKSCKILSTKHRQHSADSYCYGWIQAAFKNIELVPLTDEKQEENMTLYREKVNSKLNYRGPKKFSVSKACMNKGEIDGQNHHVRNSINS